MHVPPYALIRLQATPTRCPVEASEDTVAGHTFQLWSNQVEEMLLVVDEFFVNR